MANLFLVGQHKHYSRSPMDGSIDLHYGKQNPNWNPAAVNLTGTA